MLADLGIPPLVASGPETLHEVAREFLTQQMAGGERGSFPARAEELVDQANLRLAQAYGEAALAIWRWIERNFVNHGEQTLLWAWGMLLPRLADAYGRGGPATASPLSAAMTTEFQQIVRSRYHPGLSREDEARARSVAESSGPPDDEPFIGMFASTSDLDSATDLAPTEKIVDCLAMALGARRAVEALTELKRCLGPDDREALLGWARAEAALLDPPLVGLEITFPETVN